MHVASWLWLARRTQDLMLMISIDKVIGFKMNVYLEKGQVSKNPKQMLPTGGAYRGLSPSLCSRS